MITIRGNGYEREDYELLYKYVREMLVDFKSNHCTMACDSCKYKYLCDDVMRVYFFLAKKSVDFTENS